MPPYAASFQPVPDRPFLAPGPWPLGSWVRLGHSCPVLSCQAVPSSKVMVLALLPSPVLALPRADRVRQCSSKPTARPWGALRERERERATASIGFGIATVLQSALTLFPSPICYLSCPGTMSCIRRVGAPAHGEPTSRARRRLRCLPCSTSGPAILVPPAFTNGSRLLHESLVGVPGPLPDA